MVVLMRKSHQNYVAVCIVSLSRYSRKLLLWLKVCITNNDPEVVAGYYLECTKKYGGIFIPVFVRFSCVDITTGVPRILRADCGTENTTVAYLQPFLCSTTDSFKYGRSTTNQVYKVC